MQIVPAFVACVVPSTSCAQLKLGADQSERTCGAGASTPVAKVKRHICHGLMMNISWFFWFGPWQ